MKPVLYLDAQKPSSMFLTGTRVDEWVDSGGSGRSLLTGSLGTSYNPTFDSTLFGGKGGISFANKFLESASAFTELNWARGFTILCAGTHIAGMHNVSDSAAIVMGAGLGFRLGLGTAGTSAAGIPLVPCVFGVRWDRTKMTFILNGKTYPVHEGAPIVGSGAFGKLQLGMLVGSAGSWTGKLAGIQFFDRILEGEEISDLSSEMQLKYGIADLDTPKYNIVVDGNSLANGYWSSSTTTMMDGALGVSGVTPMDMLNAANSGISTVSLKDRAAAVVDPLLNKGVPAKRRVLIVWEISNDLSGTSQTDTAAYANIKTYCQARVSAGWKVIVCTCLPRTQSGINANFETYRLSVNASINANAVSEGWASAVADIGGDATIGVTGASDNTTYYKTDKVHLTTAGHAIAKGYITTALNAVVA